MNFTIRAEYAIDEADNCWYNCNIIVYYGGFTICETLPVTTACLFLSLLLIASCGGDVPADTTASPVSDAIVTTEAGYTLPEADFGGEEFRILLRSTSWIPQDIWAEGENGDVLNDAVYRRNRKIEEDFNVKLFAEVAPEATGSALNNYVSSFIMAGEAAYDLVMLRVSDAANLARSGLFTDLLTQEALDFSQPFWQEDKLLETTLSGRLYYATGIITNAANALNITFFNKEIAAEYKISGLYDLVNEGKWTIDALQNFARQAAKDIDGSGSMTLADQYGITAQPNIVQMLFAGSGEKMITKDQSDLPVMTVGGERSFRAADRIAQLIADKNHVYTGATEDMKSIWFGERALFYYASLNNAQVMREYDFEFGLLPLPKLDEAQENYVCHLNAHNPSGTAIPVTVDAKRAALILQAMVCLSDAEVIPAYYDVCLEGKSLRDNESAEMLDIIFASWRSDLSDAYQWAQLSGSISNAINAGEGLASLLASIKPQVESAIAATVDAYQSFN